MMRKIKRLTVIFLVARYYLAKLQERVSGFKNDLPALDFNHQYDPTIL
jgi:hypothetical protein